MRVLAKLDQCNSPYIVKHFFWQHFNLAEKSIKKPSRSLDEMLYRFFTEKRLEPGQIFAMGMEFLPGTILHWHRFSKDYSDLKYIIQAAAGLQWLHSRNIMHRDIKPENIMVNSSEKTVICENPSFL